MAELETQAKRCAATSGFCLLDHTKREVWFVHENSTVFAIGFSSVAIESFLIFEQIDTAFDHSRHAKDNSTVRSPVLRSKPKFTTEIHPIFRLACISRISRTCSIWLSVSWIVFVTFTVQSSLTAEGPCSRNSDEDFQANST